MTWSHFINKLYLAYVVVGLVVHSSVLNVSCQVCWGPMCSLGGTIGNFISENSGLVIKLPIHTISGQILTTISPSPPAHAITSVPSHNAEPRDIANEGTPTRTNRHPFKARNHNTKTTVNSGTIKGTSLPASRDTITTTSYKNHSKVEPTSHQETAPSRLTDKQVKEFLKSHKCFEMSFKLNKETITFMKPLAEQLQRQQNIQQHLEILLTGISITAAVFSLVLLTVLRIRNSMKLFVHKNLLLSLALGDLMYTLEKKLFKSRTQHSVACSSFTVIVYYLHTSLYTWMLVEGINLYLKTVKVFTTDRKYLTYLMLGWGIPGVIVGVVAAIKPPTYDMSMALQETITCGSLQFTGKVDRKRCWINGNLWTFKGPVLAILLANLVMFFIVLRVTLGRPRTNYRNASRKGLKTIIALLPLLGVPFFLGFFAKFHVAVAYAYITLNSLQGVLFFICHCVFDDQVRDAVRKLLRKKKRIQTLQQRQKGNNAMERNRNTNPSGKPKPTRVVPVDA